MDLTASWEAGCMKATLDLPDELIRETKLRAVVQSRTVKDLVAELLRQGLGMAPVRQPAKRAGKSRVQIGENNRLSPHLRSPQRRPQAPR